MKERGPIGKGKYSFKQVMVVSLNNVFLSKITITTDIAVVYEWNGKRTYQNSAVLNDLRPPCKQQDCMWREGEEQGGGGSTLSWVLMVGIH